MLEAKKIEGIPFWNKFNNFDSLAKHWYYKLFTDVIAERSGLAETTAYKMYIEELFS